MGFLNKVVASTVLTLAPILVGYLLMLGGHDLHLVGAIFLSHVKVYNASLMLQASIIYLLLE